MGVDRAESLLLWILGSFLVQTAMQQDSGGPWQQPCCYKGVHGRQLGEGFDFSMLCVGSNWRVFPILRKRRNDIYAGHLLVGRKREGAFGPGLPASCSGTL